MIRKIALILTVTSFVLVFALPVLADIPTHGTVTRQDYIGGF